jgi:hypothetical protein
MTREEVINLEAGDRVEHTLDTAHGEALPNARYSAPREIVEIFARGISDKGHAYVCFYTEFGAGSRMSGTILEGEEMYRLAGNRRDEGPAPTHRDARRVAVTDEELDAIDTVEEWINRAQQAVQR